MKRLIYFNGNNHTDVYEFDEKTNERTFIKTINKSEDMKEGPNKLEGLHVNAKDLKSNLILNGNSGNEILRLEDNGDVYYKGKLIDNDTDLVNQFKKFLNGNL